MKKVSVVVISLTSPLLVGVYKNRLLIEQFQSNLKTSDALPGIFDIILQKYSCKDLYYAKGPGSFMAIKITYLFLKTISITKKLPLFGTVGFTFNQNSPIKAIGTLYFIKKDGKILTQKIDIIKQKILPFNLPDKLDKKIFIKDAKPLYILPAL